MYSSSNGVAFLRRHYPEGYREAYVGVPDHYGMTRETGWRKLLTESGFTIVSWRLVSRFPVLDHSPWIHLDASAKFPGPIRSLGKLSGKVASIRMAAPLWTAAIVLLDRLLRPAMPRRWAYRLLFVAQK